MIIKNPAAPIRAISLVGDGAILFLLPKERPTSINLNVQTIEECLFLSK